MALNNWKIEMKISPFWRNHCRVHQKWSNTNFLSLAAAKVIYFTTPGEDNDEILDKTVQWRHNGCDSVPNHQPHDCLLNRLFRRRSKKTPKLRITGLCAGNSLVAGEFPAQMTSNAEYDSIWWRYHDDNISVSVYWTFHIVYAFYGLKLIVWIILSILPEVFVYKGDYQSL